MKFIDALGILSKASSQAVIVENRPDSELDEFKDYLHVKTDIERDFWEELRKIQPGQIIFLCGSSGDGKSAILTQHKKHHPKVTFHLDATHSFHPKKNAVETLDGVFSKAKSENQALVVGINIGMIGNYVGEGADEHDDIKESMSCFIERRPVPSEHIYLYFEDYPKFSVKEDSCYCKFARELFELLTVDIEENPFRQLREAEGNGSILHANFDLLSLPSVQDAIVTELYKARLVKDQFLTARSLLDFIHHLLCGESYLFDNLFTPGENEISSSIATFDPSKVRTRSVDDFLVKHGLRLLDADFDNFATALEQMGILPKAPESFVRLFYLLRKHKLANNYHHRFKEDFENLVLNKFTRCWWLHQIENPTTDQQAQLREVYTKTIIPSIQTYMNRSCPELGTSHLFLSNRNGYVIACPEIRIKYSPETNEQGVAPVGTFQMTLRVSSHAIPPIAVNINLFELMLRINQGYRPNKHDKNCVVLLDDLIEKITKIGNKRNEVIMLKNGKGHKLIRDEEYIEVEEC